MRKIRLCLYKKEIICSTNEDIFFFKSKSEGYVYSYLDSDLYRAFMINVSSSIFFLFTHVYLRNVS